LSQERNGQCFIDQSEIEKSIAKFSGQYCVAAVKLNGPLLKSNTRLRTVLPQHRSTDNKGIIDFFSLSNADH
jgi:hypothetical protein